MHLKSVERPAVIQAIATAREHGDLSENAEYHAARDKQSFIEGRIKDIENKLALAEVIDPSKLAGDRVAFGATVKLVERRHRRRGHLPHPRRRRGRPRQGQHQRHEPARAIAHRQAGRRRGEGPHARRRAHVRGSGHRLWLSGRPRAPRIRVERPPPRSARVGLVDAADVLVDLGRVLCCAENTALALPLAAAVLGRLGDRAGALLGRSLDCARACLVRRRRSLVVAGWRARGRAPGGVARAEGLLAVLGCSRPRAPWRSALRRAPFRELGAAAPVRPRCWSRRGGAQSGALAVPAPGGRGRAVRWGSRRSGSRIAAAGVDGRRVRPAAPLPGVSRGAAPSCPARRRARRAGGARGERRRRRGALAFAAAVTALAASACAHSAGGAAPRARAEPAHRPGRARPAAGRAVTFANALRPPRRWTPRAGRAGRDCARRGRAVARLDRARLVLLYGRRAARRSRLAPTATRGPPRRTSTPWRAKAPSSSGAYCPTPHTSYSVTSMMTGKYLRPLLALGLGAGLGDAGPHYLRRYGWRTAAFYPPAVFFIDERPLLALRAGAARLRVREGRVRGPRRCARSRWPRTSTRRRPTGRCFFWVHFFEPHEPYVDARRRTSSRAARRADVDAYDSEVATADDGIGRIVRLVRARRPGAVVIVTADHGEEFGEHGGPLPRHDRLRGAGARAARRRRARGSRRARVRDRRADHRSAADGALGARHSAPGAPARARPRARCWPAAAKAHDDGLRVRRDRRLRAHGVGRRPARLPAPRRRLRALPPGGRPARAARPLGRRPGALRRAARRCCARSSATTGATRRRAGSAWPEALRRGLQGDVDAAPDVAALLDDADVAIRRKAAEVCFAPSRAGDRAPR